MNTVNEKRPLILNSAQQIKLPETQNIADKNRLIERKKTTIANMKSLLLEEVNQSALSKKRINEIASILHLKTEEKKKIVAFKAKEATVKNKDEEKEDLDTMLESLLQSNKVSARCKRIAQIILDEELGIKEAKKSILVFKAHDARMQKEFDRIRQNNALLANTGKQH